MEQIVFNTPIGRITTKEELRAFLVEDEIDLYIEIKDFSDDLQEQINLKLKERKLSTCNVRRKMYEQRGVSSYESLIKNIDDAEIIEEVLNVRVHKDKSIRAEIQISAGNRITLLPEYEISVPIDISPYYIILQGLLLQSVSNKFF